MKLKTHSGSKKRFKVLPSGKVKRRKSNKGHLLTGKKRSRKRRLAKATYVHDAASRQIRQLMVF
jgi:large subunit ribosomal protein L35